MTKIRDTSDPILFPTEANENKAEKKRAGKGIIIFRDQAFFALRAPITVSQSSPGLCDPNLGGWNEYGFSGHCQLSSSCG